MFTLLYFIFNFRSSNLICSNILKTNFFLIDTYKSCEQHRQLSVFSLSDASRSLWHRIIEPRACSLDVMQKLYEVIYQMDTLNTTSELFSQKIKSHFCCYKYIAISKNPIWSYSTLLTSIITIWVKTIYVHIQRGHCHLSYSIVLQYDFHITLLLFR